MLPEFCGSSLLFALPDDIFAIISLSLTPRDICNLSLCCRSLCALVASEKIWFSQCEMVGTVPNRELVEWRKGVSSYRALCRFLVSVKPLLGLWVHQNPELGNVVYVMPGFVSVVGCRIIPQELGPLGIEDGPILWAPVFEIIGDVDGSTLFFLHGREKSCDYLYPGSVKSVDKNCNVLLLEIEPRQQKSGNKLFPNKSFAYNSEKEQSLKISRSSSGLLRSQYDNNKLPFSRLPFSERRKLIEVVTSQVGRKVSDSENRRLFPRSRIDEENFQNDIVFLVERRLLLLEMCQHGGSRFDLKDARELASDPTQLQLNVVRKSLNGSSALASSQHGDDCLPQYTTKKTLGGYLRAGFRNLGKSLSITSSWAHSKNSSSGCENKHGQLHEFLISGDTIGLTLCASTMRLSSYRAWPNMHESRFALYKLPMHTPRAYQKYAGLWGGTFGWPPGKPTEDKPGKALFFLLISYEECEGQQLLIATKILEGTHYVLHPNGSAMFIANIDEPSQDLFPWDVDADSNPVIVEHSFAGEGIANGYGFRYPGSKPGSLFVMNDFLAFIWKESGAVLTMRRLNLEDLLKKGERVPALPPIANFSYLTKSYSNVFAGFADASTCTSSTRQRHH